MLGLLVSRDSEMPTSRISPLSTISQSSRWTSHLRVPHHMRFSLRSRLANPRRQPGSVTAWRARFVVVIVLGMVAIISTSFDDLQKDRFQVLLLPPKREHGGLLIVEYERQ